MLFLCCCIHFSKQETSYKSFNIQKKTKQPPLCKNILSRNTASRNGLRIRTEHRKCANPQRNFIKRRDPDICYSRLSSGSFPREPLEWASRVGLVTGPEDLLSASSRCFRSFTSLRCQGSVLHILRLSVGLNVLKVSAQS